MRSTFARHYDRFTAAMEREWLDDARQAQVGELRGTVVEIGSGTGKNLRHYPAGVERLVLTEPNPTMRDQLRTRVAHEHRPFEVEIVDATAERIPLPDASADAVVSTLVLCSVPNLPMAAAELRRVLRPGGELHLLEHVVSDDPRERRWQERLDRVWNWLEGSCHIDHDPLTALSVKGFDVDGVEVGTQHGMPPLFRAMARGVAVAV